MYHNSNGPTEHLALVRAAATNIRMLLVTSGSDGASGRGRPAPSPSQKGSVRGEVGVREVAMSCIVSYSGNVNNTGDSRYLAMWSATEWCSGIGIQQSVVWPEPETNMAEAPEQQLYLLVAGAWSSTSSGASCAGSELKTNLASW
ncbi:uncharacterized protein LOC124661739 [Lolium rigidum]|uniref:uncharacterized protein LOC124661739 n=1 Tax=Lolium rigidum TaxID=89674 RepID=UPI001F5DF0AF|nr:uncharacterized protein LOC124661739 [Lolium rigidum]